uniref:Choline O-acetyltransferase n=1 Tax=Isodiametra pulchra TaxID=504439 RepID=A0A2P1DVA2_ISOPU|nr:choline acetyltransferase protein [Isodiametra pulchra]
MSKENIGDQICDYDDHQNFSTTNHLYQLRLGKQPVPDLASSIEDFLLHSGAVLSQSDQSTLTQLAHEFVATRGPSLVEKLANSTHGPTANWSYGPWVRDMYLRCRKPLPVYSNPAMLVERRAFLTENHWLRFAARVVCELLRYRHMLITGKTGLEYVRSLEFAGGKQPLCMEQYRSLFTSCRRPGEELDSQVRFPDNFSLAHRLHVIVAFRGKLYTVRLEAADEGVPDLEPLAASLREIVHAGRNAAMGVGDELGLLTGAPRHEWAHVYNSLCKVEKNACNIRELESAVLVLCLDEEADGSPDDSRDLTRLLTGGEHSQSNRWFDKAIQVIVGSDGLLGVNVEHSTAEGVVLVRIMQQVLANLQEETCTETNGDCNGVDGNKVIPLDWVINAKLASKIKETAANQKRLLNDLSIRKVVLDDIGKRWIKSRGVNPDVFVQILLQLTYHACHGQLCHTYESASLRRFERGRVDNIRSNNPAVLRLAQAISQHRGEEELQALFHEACRFQQRTIDKVISGHGCDLLLQSLREEVTAEGRRDAFLHSDLFTQCWSFDLGTSQVTMPEGPFMFYGPMEASGYGACYNLLEDRAVLCLSALQSSPRSSLSLFCTNLTRVKDTLLSIT